MKKSEKYNLYLQLQFTKYRHEHIISVKKYDNISIYIVEGNVATPLWYCVKFLHLKDA